MKDKNIEQLIALAKRNARHITIINSEMGDVRDEMKEMRRGSEKNTIILERLNTDMEWVKKTYWIIATASIGALVVGVLNIVAELPR